MFQFLLSDSVRLVITAHILVNAAILITITSTSSSHNVIVRAKQLQIDWDAIPPSYLQMPLHRRRRCPGDSDHSIYTPNVHTKLICADIQKAAITLLCVITYFPPPSHGRGPRVAEIQGGGDIRSPRRYEKQNDDCHNIGMFVHAF